MSTWHLHAGSWWCLQWCWSMGFSLGIHVDPWPRWRADGQLYGPYVDLHLGFAILSLGWHPGLAGELERSVSTSAGKH